MTISSSSSSFARARVDRRVERVRLDVVVARRVAILVVDARVVVIIIGRVTVWRKDLGPDSMTTAERARDAWRDALEASTTGTSSSSPPPIAGVERARGRRATSQHQNHQHNQRTERTARAREVANDFVSRALDRSFDVDGSRAWWRELDEASERDAGFGVAALAAFARERRRDDAGTNGRSDVDEDGTGDAETVDEPMGDAEACARWEADDESFCARATRALASLESARDVDGAPSARRDAFRRDVADTSRGLSEWWCRGRGSGVTYEACRDALMASRRFARGSTRDGRAATPQDACLLRVACRAKAYDDIDAFGLLDDARSVEIDAGGTCLEATDFLLSRYYGGRAHLARKRYDDAAKWFRDAVTAPANALSAIAVVCLKKYVLARALSEKTSLAALSRAESELPPYTSAAVTRYAASRDFDAYAEMQTAIASRSVDEYERVAEAHAETYAADGNAGLVDLLRERVLAERARGLAETYSTLRLEDAARILRVPSARDAEILLCRAALGGYVNAVIDGVDGIVRFLEDDAVDAPTDADVADALRRRLEAAHALDARVREENARLAKSRKYVTHEVNETRKTAAAQTRMESQS